MKRNFPENTGRTTAGCLPVPLFNQRKRSRQPLTSNPLQNELGSNNSAENFDFSAMLADCGWETAKPKPTPTPLQKPTSLERNLERNGSHASVRERSDFSPAFGSGRGNRPSLQTETGSWGGQKESKLAGNPKAWPQSGNKAGTTARSGLPVPRGAYSFKPNPCRPEAEADGKMGKATFPKDNTMMQKGPVPRATLKGKDRSLRILSAVIESMKHWSQLAEKPPLLFEVLGVLDSAVTPGPCGAKNFLLRDGKESVPCAFYEIDRGLPRLIRGRVHRCVGNYDARGKLLRCVSVRPATADEEHTFQDFVRAADLEMGKYEKTSHEA